MFLRRDLIVRASPPAFCAVSLVWDLMSGSSTDTSLIERPAFNSASDPVAPAIVSTLLGITQVQA